MTPKPETGSGHAAKLRRDQKDVAEEAPPLTPEQHRELMLMEALNERSKIERLRREHAERIRLERKDRTYW